jgi:hypothetical protein
LLSAPRTGPDFHRLDRISLGLAHSLDHFVGAGDRRRRDGDTKSFLGMLFIASARYRIKFAHTAKYKTKPHAITINTSQIAILPNLGTSP